MSKKTVLSLALLGLLALAGAGCVSAQPGYDSDHAYCTSGASGTDFTSCMRGLQLQRQGYDRRGDWQHDNRRGYDQRGGYDHRGGYGDRQGWGAPPPPPPRYEQPWRQPERSYEQPRLSDMQRRALDNCAMLQRRDQPRCRATVMSTVR